MTDCTADVIDMLLSSLVFPEYASLYWPAREELIQRDVLERNQRVTPEFLQQLYDFHTGRDRLTHGSRAN